MSECLIILERCQRIGEKRDYGFDWTVFLSNRWRANAEYIDGDHVRPTTLLKQTGFEYECNGGQTNGKKEPSWPKALGRSVVDGSLTWTAVPFAVEGLADEVSVSVWTPPVSGPTISNEGQTTTPGAQLTTAEVTHDTAGTFDIVNEITTTGGLEYHGILRLTIEP